MECLVPIEHADAARQKLAQGRNVPRPVHCSEYVVPPPVDIPSFFFCRRWLTHRCLKPRVPRWRLHMCVRSRASGQNSSSCRSHRPNWPLNSTSFVDVPDETGTAPAVCQGVYSHFLGQDGTACEWATRRAAGCSCLRGLGFQGVSLPCEGTSMVVVCAILCRCVV